MIIKNGNVYNTELRKFEKKDIYVKDGKTAALGELGEVCDADVIDAEGLYVIPGLVDVHTHGRAGYDFLSCPREMLSHMSASYAQSGVTAVMPTLASAPLDEMYDAARAIDGFVADDNGAQFCGVHIEGRYLNASKRGAHKADLVAVLDPDELDGFSGNKALHITAAFELDRDFAFAKKALSMGATVALGHTMATYAEAKEAERHGVSAYTHLYNAMPSLHHREGGAVCAAFMSDAYAELICDGIHIAPEMIALAYKNKGNDRTVLISDSMEATGCPDGEYSIAGNPAIVKDGIALTPDGALAGSTLNLFDGLKNLMKFCSITLEEALPCATVNPCREVGVDKLFGSIDVGKSADYLLLDSKTEPKIIKKIIRGKCFE